MRPRRSRRALRLAAALAASACGSEAPPAPAPPAPATAGRAAADPARGVAAELDAAALAFGGGVLAEVTGAEVAARAAFERALAAADAPPPVAARAALHLAQLELRAGSHRHALELAARASLLDPASGAIAEGVAQLRAEVVAAAGADDIRGPRLGTPLPGVAAPVAEAFAAAERAFAAVAKLRPRPYLEALFATIRYKEDATAAVVARYRAVAEHGGLAAIASHYRAGSLFHDLAIALQIQLPPELEGRSKLDLRGLLRQRAIAYLRRAAAEYRAALDVPVAPDAELWRLAAETDLRRANDALGGAGR
jgi:hypothetical protein